MQTVTTEEVATWLGTSQRVVRTLARAGALPGGKMGAEWRFTTTALNALFGVDQADGLTPLLQPSSVAAILQLHISTVYRRLADGSIPSVRLGKKWHVSHERLNLLLQRGLQRQR